ncbi:MAG: 16S rRNA (cytosine(1402)-N(4))-methyltransferase RsmH [Clostridia bacterium]|nr:16S rRNA (cytosine(1402)-N(4))-methyltransferase RsmH [Clostridia bacterium]
MEFKHIPIMLNEVIDNLKIKPNGIYVDGTMGGAGHSEAIVKKLSNEGLLIGIDRDQEALNASHERLKEFENVRYIWGKHEDLKDILFGMGIKKIDGILLDLGISSYQIDEASRGFSYTKEAPLDMRMNKEQELTAREVVNTYSKEKLEKIFFDYGEENFSKRIAAKIIEKREMKSIETTSDLCDVIRSSIPKGKDAVDSFKRIFQAIRIEVNGELKDLEKAIKDGIEIMNEGGRFCILTFHSLEDRIVKNAFNDAAGKCTCPKDFPVCVCNAKSFGKIINKKPIIPSEEEQINNPRSKSCKLRVFEREKEHPVR